MFHIGGGFCVQPTKELFQLLYDKGIKVDSSVALKQRMYSEAHRYDYHINIDKLNWISSSGIIEVPIGAVQNSLLQRIIHGTDFASLRGNETRGEAIHTVKSKKMNKLKYLFRYNTTQKTMSLDSMPYKQLLYGLQKYYKKYNCRNEEVYLAVLGHPKMLDDVRYSNLEAFIKEIQKCYQDKYRFVTLREAYEDLKDKNLLSYDV